jgi:hypothetical protein
LGIWQFLLTGDMVRRYHYIAITRYVEIKKFNVMAHSK